MDTFGIGRSMEPAHSLPQQAWRIDNTTCCADELLIDVKIVSINLVSFNEIWEGTGDIDTRCAAVMEIIQSGGMLHNPVTTRVGLSTDKVAQMGLEYPKFVGLAPGARLFPWVPSINPLKLDRILCVGLCVCPVEVEGRAILYAVLRW